jgi:hypothetical protein
LVGKGNATPLSSWIHFPRPEQAGFRLESGISRLVSQISPREDKHDSRLSSVFYNEAAAKFVEENKLNVSSGLRPFQGSENSKLSFPQESEIVKAI